MFTNRFIFTELFPEPKTGQLVLNHTLKGATHILLCLLVNTEYSRRLEGNLYLYTQGSWCEQRPGRRAVVQYLGSGVRTVRTAGTGLGTES